MTEWLSKLRVWLPKTHWMPASKETRSDREMEIAHTRALAHHHGEWKLLDASYIIDVGGLANAISSGTIDRFSFGNFDHNLLDRSAVRVDGAVLALSGEDFFPPALERPALAISDHSGEVVVIDGHRRARRRLSRLATDMAPMIVVSLYDISDHVRRVDELTSDEQRLLATMMDHPVRFTDGSRRAGGHHVAPVRIPPSEEGRPPNEYEIGVLFGACLGLAREVVVRAEQRHHDDPRRRVRARAFSKAAYLRGVVARLGDLTLTPNLAVATSTLSAEYAEGIAHLGAYSRLHFGDDEIVLSRLVDCGDDELETRFVIVSRALAATKWDQSRSKAHGQLIDAGSHVRKRLPGDELSAKISGGLSQAAMRDLPLRAMCDLARLVGINVAEHYPDVRNAHEVVEWYRRMFFFEQGYWRDIGGRSLAMNFSLWHRQWRMYDPSNSVWAVPEVALLWRALFNMLAVTAIPPGAPRSNASTLLDLCLEKSDEIFHARRGVYRMIHL